MTVDNHRLQQTVPAISFALPAGAIQLVNPLRPAFVSQKTSLAILGIPPDRFLLMVRAPGFPLRTTIQGKLRLVETEPLIVYLRDLGQFHQEIGADDISANDNEPAPMNEDDAARKLGSALGFTFNDDPPASGRRRKG